MQNRHPVRVIDSKSVSMAQGLVVMAAAELAGAGKQMDDVAGAAVDMIPRIRLYGALDTLENLKKGGRVGSAQALLGSMLSIKPIIELRDGKVEPESKQRTRSKALATSSTSPRPAIRLAVRPGAPPTSRFLDLVAAVSRARLIVGEVGAVIGNPTRPAGDGCRLLARR